MRARFEIITGEGRTYGPFTAREMRELADRLPAWICWQVQVVGCG